MTATSTRSQATPGPGLAKQAPTGGEIAPPQAFTAPISLMAAPDAAGREDRLLRAQRALADWARQTPRAAVEFAAALPAGSDRGVLLTTAVSLWVEHDPVAASAWLEAAPNHPDFDGAFFAVVAHPAVLQHRPATALSWAEAISAPARRWEAIRLVVQQWALRDPAAASASVAGLAHLSSSERSHLLERVAQRSPLLD